MVRNPLEVAHSLGARNLFPIRYSLALWERYTREALTGLEGLPVLVTLYGSLLADPAGWCGETVAFLNGVGLEARLPAPADLGEFLDPALRRSVEGPDSLAVPAVSAEQRHLDELLRGAAGTHDSFHLQPSEPETPSAAGLIARHRAAVVAAGNTWLIPAAN